MERLPHTHSDDRSELLSAYIDSAVDVVERRRAEEYIQGCTACAQEVRELRMFKELLGDLPKLQPPRSFTLDPQAAARPRWLLFPMLRLASVMAVLLLFVVLGVDGLSSIRSGTSAESAAPSGEMSSRSMRQAPDAAAPLAGEPAGGTTGSAAAGTGGGTEAGLAPMPSAAAETAPAQAGTAAGGTTGAAGGTGAAGDAPADAAAGVTAMGGANDAASTAGVEGEDTALSASKAGETAAADTVTMDQNPATADNATPSPFDTTLLVELTLALEAVAFGVGAFVAWRRGI